MDEEASEEFLRFEEYLEEEGYRLTEEREQIARKVFSQERHFEAEDLLFKLRQEGTDVSRATIYRTLELLLNSDLVQKVDFGDGYSLYELSHGSPHHNHLYCQQCGKVVRFQNERLAELQNSICDEYNFEPVEFSHQIFGYCDRCRSTNGD